MHPGIPIVEFLPNEADLTVGDLNDPYGMIARAFNDYESYSY